MAESDPFAPPTSGDAPEYALFTPNQVGVTTLLGTPLAGGLLLMLNANRLRHSLGGVVLWTAGMIGAMVGIAMILPEDWPGTGLSVGAAFGMRGVGEHLFGDSLAAHTERGGESGPWWLAILLGFGILVPLVVVVVLVAVAAGGI